MFLSYMKYLGIVLVLFALYVGASTPEESGTTENVSRMFIIAMFACGAWCSFNHKNKKA